LALPLLPWERYPDAALARRGDAYVLALLGMALAAGAVALGYRHRCPLSDDEAVKKAKLVIEKEASELAKEFTKEFGTMVCIDLVGIDFSVPEQRRRYFAENITKDTCDRFVAFAVRKLYELEDKRSQS